MQVDPTKHVLNAHGTERLKLKYEGPLSNYAFDINLRRYTPCRRTTASRRKWRSAAWRAWGGSGRANSQVLGTPEYRVSGLEFLGRGGSRRVWHVLRSCTLRHKREREREKHFRVYKQALVLCPGFRARPPCHLTHLNPRFDELNVHPREMTWRALIGRPYGAAGRRLPARRVGRTVASAGQRAECRARVQEVGWCMLTLSKTFSNRLATCA